MFEPIRFNPHSLPCCGCTIFRDRFTGRTDVSSPVAPWQVIGDWSIEEQDAYRGRVRWIWATAPQYGVEGAPQVTRWWPRAFYAVRGYMTEVDAGTARIELRSTLSAVVGDLLEVDPITGTRPSYWPPHYYGKITAVDELTVTVVWQATPTELAYGYVLVRVHPWRLGTVVSRSADTRTGVIQLYPGHGITAADRAWGFATYTPSQNWWVPVQGLYGYEVVSAGATQITIYAANLSVPAPGSNWTVQPAEGPRFLSSMGSTWPAAGPWGWGGTNWDWPGGAGPAAQNLIPPGADGTGEGQLAIADGWPFSAAVTTTPGDTLILDLPSDLQAYRLTWNWLHRGLRSGDRVRLIVDYTDDQNYLCVEREYSTDTNTCFGSTGLPDAPTCQPYQPGIRIIRVAAGTETVLSPVNHIFVPWYGCSGVDCFIADTDSEAYQTGSVSVFPATDPARAGEHVIQVASDFAAYATLSGNRRVGIAAGSQIHELALVQALAYRLRDDRHPDCAEPAVTGFFRDGVVPPRIRLVMGDWVSGFEDGTPVPCSASLAGEYLLDWVADRQYYHYEGEHDCGELLVLDLVFSSFGLYSPYTLMFRASANGGTSWGGLRAIQDLEEAQQGWVGGGFDGLTITEATATDWYLTAHSAIGAPPHARGISWEGHIGGWPGFSWYVADKPTKPAADFSLQLFVERW
jgi:hypothetical protein